MNLKTEAREKFQHLLYAGFWQSKLGASDDILGEINTLIDHVLSEVEKGVPEEVEKFSYEGPFQDGQRDGWNDCRTQILAHLASLKSNN